MGLWKMQEQVLGYYKTCNWSIPKIGILQTRRAVQETLLDQVLAFKTREQPKIKTEGAKIQYIVELAKAESEQDSQFWTACALLKGDIYGIVFFEIYQRSLITS